METLPPNVNDKANEFSSILLSQLIELCHIEMKIATMERNKSYYPNACFNKFNPTCKKKFADLKQFKDMKQDSNKAIQELKNKLQAIIYRKEKMKEKELQKTLYTLVIKRLYNLFEIYTCAVWDEDTNLTPP